MGGSGGTGENGTRSPVRRRFVVTVVLGALAFGAELAMLVAFPVAGWSLAGWAGLVAGVVVSVAVALLWGARLAPRAPRRWRGVPLMATRVGLLTGAAAALAGAGHIAAGVALAVAGWLGQLGADPHRPDAPAA
jgi:hypothetical protein